MQFRGGGNIDEMKPPTLSWRRSSRSEAFQTGCCVFTLAMALGVGWDFVVSDTIAYADRFFYAFCYGFGFGIAALFVKSRAVFHR